MDLTILRNMKTTRLPACRTAWIALLSKKSTAELRGIYGAVRAYVRSVESADAFDAAVEQLLVKRDHNLGSDPLSYVYAAFRRAESVALAASGCTLLSAKHDAIRGQLAALLHGQRRAVA